MDSENSAAAHGRRMLVVSGSEKGIEFFEELAKGIPLSMIHERSAAEAAVLLSRTPIDVIVVNAPLADDEGGAFAVRCAQSSFAGVLLLVRTETAQTKKAEEAGVLVLTKPAGKAAILTAVKLSCAVSRRLFAARSTADSLKSKMDEWKIVNRAKWLLIGKLGMSEADAHRYIEKLAMDTRQTRREIADGIIKTYEN